MASNLQSGAPGADAAAMRHALEVAQADFITGDADGLARRVSQGGTNFSGGQRQRLAIARALMKDAPILLLDDALSAVDTDTERQILDNLHRLRKGRTTIIVAHRISTIQDADHILVLDEGKVEEYGTHEELLKTSEIYREVYESQTNGGDENA